MGVKVDLFSVAARDLVREDKKTTEEARSARCPKEQIQRGHADVAERCTG